MQTPTPVAPKTVPAQTDDCPLGPPLADDANGSAAGAPVKPTAVGCVFAGIAMAVAERSPQEYAAFLEEL